MAVSSTGIEVAANVTLLPPDGGECVLACLGVATSTNGAREPWRFGVGATNMLSRLRTAAELLAEARRFNEDDDTNTRYLSTRQGNKT